MREKYINSVKAKWDSSLAKQWEANQHKLLLSGNDWEGVEDYLKEKFGKKFIRTHRKKTIDARKDAIAVKKAATKAKHKEDKAAAKAEYEAKKAAAKATLSKAEYAANKAAAKAEYEARKAALYEARKPSKISKYLARKSERTQKLLAQKEANAAQDGA